MSDQDHESTDFIRQIVEEDLKAGKHKENRDPISARTERLSSHWPRQVDLPEFRDCPGIRRRCHLRFDDTNPTKEETEYVDSIKEDVRWLGFDWGDHLFFASDYFEQLYDWAVKLIRRAKRTSTIRTPKKSAKAAAIYSIRVKSSPFRDRSVEENLDLFEEMRAGRVRRRGRSAAGQDRHGRIPI